jgi:hypothetical protein
MVWQSMSLINDWLLWRKPVINPEEEAWKWMAIDDVKDDMQASEIYTVWFKNFDEFYHFRITKFNSIANLNFLFKIHLWL